MGENEPLLGELLSALRVARSTIASVRADEMECETKPDGAPGDPDALAAIAADYDAPLAQIDAAIAKAVAALDPTGPDVLPTA